MFKLDKPRDTDTHTRADFAELLCLFDLDRTCSQESLSDYIRDNNENGRGLISDEELNDVWAHIRWRAIAFGDYYPFRFHDNGSAFFAAEELTEKQKIYSFLLLCANLPFVEPDSNPLTNAFERVATHAMRNSWYQGGDIRNFGKVEGVYEGAKWERINALARDIGASPVCNENTFRRRDAGDGGIDIVGWLVLDSYERRNIPSGLAQCACSRNDWVKKQGEISHDRLAPNILYPSTRWEQIIFIPHCFRGNRGEWAVDGEVGMTVVFDRLRIVGRIDIDLNIDAYDLPDLFDDFLDFRLELV